jgi:DUF4097 and DUF4098 domain-containing protein YvlB
MKVKTGSFITLALMTSALTFTALSCAFVYDEGLSSGSAQAGQGDSGLQFQHSFKKSFTMGSIGVLSLQTEYGAIEIIPTDAESVEVEVSQKVRARDQKEADEILNDFRVEFNQSAAGLRIEAKFNKGWKPLKESSNPLGMFRDGLHLIYWDKLREHRFRISVPRKLSVDLKTRYGDITIGGLEGEVRAFTSKGELNLGSIKGRTFAETAAGNVTAQECSSAATLKTAGGDIRVSQAEDQVEVYTMGGSVVIDKARGRVKAETLGGSIDIRAAYDAIEAATKGGTIEARILGQPRGPSRLESLSGGVVVHLAESVAVNLDAVASDSVSSDFELLNRRAKVNALSGEINGGGPLLLIRSTSGGIEIRKTARSMNVR